MINQDYFRNKKITVVGLGRSGFACARLLNELKVRVSITEKSDGEDIQELAKQLPSPVEIELGRHTQDFIQGRDLIVTSPGVEPLALPLIWAKSLGIPVISEIECAWKLCPAFVIATTGTNGKTTTTFLIGEILKKAGKKTFVLGNIGKPFSAEVDKMQKGDYVSLEVSSFQLETITTFKPRVALILNFTPDHLDRYRNLSEYLTAKSRIFINQDESDYLVLNHDDPALKDFANKSKARVIYFNRNLHSNPNFAAAMAVASILGIETGLCADVFGSFKGLPHRLEAVAEFQQREFINDSKATNVDSTIYALKSITKPVILIAGGKDKGADFRLIKDLICHKVKTLILLGKARDKLKAEFLGCLPIKEAMSLEEAVAIAFGESCPGDCILLSPMCASFDMFKNYEHRGEGFKDAVRKLMGECDRRELIS